MSEKNYQEIYRTFAPPYEAFDHSLLGPTFPRELSTVSRLWFACGYRPGIASYLNFFLLRDFITTHDTAYLPRFHSFGSMAESFYQTDLFIRGVTDSGKQPTGGISSPAIRKTLRQIMARHQRIAIPSWMMTYFGFSLMEMVEKQVGMLTEEQRQLHLAYMAKAFRIMGLAFGEQRERLEAFARGVEEAHAGLTPQLEQHARHILILGEMVGVSSHYDAVTAMLPPATRGVFDPVYPRVRPHTLKQIGARMMGRLLIPQAVGQPREAIPLSDEGGEAPIAP